MIINLNFLKKISIGGEIVRKKINKIINSGKEKIKRKKIEIGMLALINTVIGFNVNAEPLNLPKEYSEILQ